MDTMKIVLVDHHAPMTQAWRRCFDGTDVTLVEGDYFATPADAMVSPANSFGIMDGGLDLAIRDELGLAVQRELQRVRPSTRTDPSGRSACPPWLRRPRRQTPRSPPTPPDRDPARDM